MKIKELREILGKFDDEREIKVHMSMDEHYASYCSKNGCIFDVNIGKSGEVIMKVDSEVEESQ
jgi:hypothetical protein